MHCDQCGSENRSGSKFCRHCGNSLSDTFNGYSEKKKVNLKIAWKSPAVLAFVGLLAIGCFIYGGSRVYAYFQVESKINTAKKMQASNDYKGSTDVIGEWKYKTVTGGQKAKIENIISENQKFANYKALFDDAVLHENDVAVTDLQNALEKLQSIDSSYPDYKKVQSEITKIQTKLVTALQDESSANKKAAADASAAAAAARAAKNKAEASAATAAADATAQEVQKSFLNQLIILKQNLENDCIANVSEGANYYNSGQTSYAAPYFGAAITACSTANKNATNLNDTFSGLPVSYSSAANNLAWAAYYEGKVVEDYVNNTYASDDVNNAFYYYDLLKAFLQS